MSQTSEIPPNVHSRNEDSFSRSSVSANAPSAQSGGVATAPTPIEVPAVSVRNASKSFPRPDLPPVEAIADISLDVQLGEFVVIVGPSGCGKSTLLNIVAGLAEPDIGSVSLQGDLDAERIGRGRIHAPDRPAPPVAQRAVERHPRPRNRRHPARRRRRESHRVGATLRNSRLP